MNKEIDFAIPNREEFRKGCEIYNQKETKGPIYFKAKSIIDANWGDPPIWQSEKWGRPLVFQFLSISE